MRRNRPAPLAILLSALAALPATAAVPSPDALKEKAPDTFYARFETTKGAFVVQVKREMAPNGADRFYNLVKSGFYDGQAFFRVVKGFVVQWGIPGDPAAAAAWASARIPDDPVKEHNAAGTITFAKSGPGSRTTQVFINLSDNRRSLDKAGFAPFGIVVEGMDVVRKLHPGYGDMVSQGGRGVDVPRLYQEGDRYLKASFPKLDRIVKASVL
jgi:peptidyl-prolyl cis-trans isomerase A (cyclophilin A)